MTNLVQLVSAQPKINAHLVKQEKFLKTKLVLADVLVHHPQPKWFVHKVLQLERVHIVKEMLVLIVLESIIAEVNLTFFNQFF